MASGFGFADRVITRTHEALWNLCYSSVPVQAKYENTQLLINSIQQESNRLGFLQIDLCPVSDESGVSLTGPGPEPEGAPHVSTTFLLQDCYRGSGGWLRPSYSEPGPQSR